jgi:uncharacterized protein (UPF0297 family)
MENKILEQVETFIKETIEILEKQYKHLEQKGYGTQNLYDLTQGQIRLSTGIVVPTKAIEYYIVYDHYESIIVQSFIQLLKNIFEERESSFVAFSLRTLIDVGVYRINILYANEITKQDKHHVKLLASLIDFVSTDGTLFRKYFTELFEAEKTHFNKKELKLLEDILSLIKSRNNIELTEKVIQARRLLSKVEKSILLKIKPLPFLKNIRSIYSWQSHMLHGNPILLQNVFDTKNKERGKLKVLTILMITGLNALNQLASYLSDPIITTEVQNKNKEIETLWPAFINFGIEKFRRQKG